MIIGLTGLNASGKGEVAKYLVSKGFEYLSLSDELREEAKNKGIEVVRENLINLGNQLREKHGASYLATLINKKIIKNNNYVIDSLRNPSEISELRKNEDFLLLGIRTAVETRFQRSLERGRDGDAKTLEEFKALEQRENVEDKNTNQLNKCLGLADKYINNDGTLKELYKQIDELI